MEPARSVLPALSTVIPLAKSELLPPRLVPYESVGSTTRGCIWSYPPCPEREVSTRLQPEVNGNEAAEPPMYLIRHWSAHRKAVFRCGGGQSPIGVQPKVGSFPIARRMRVESAPGRSTQVASTAGPVPANDRSIPGYMLR